VTSQTAIRSESCRSPDRVILLADMKVLQRITDNLRDWLDEWKEKEPEAEAPSHRSCDLLLKATRGVTIAVVSSRERKRRQPGLATRRSCSADRPAGRVLCRVLPIAGRCRSSGRSGLRLATRSRPAFLSVNRPDAPSACAGSFFIGLDDCGVLRGMAWPGAHVGKAQLLQQRRDMALVIVDAETRLDDLLKIDAPPAHHAVDGKVGTGLDKLLQCEVA
jgi:hypothetical protein